MLGLPGTEPTDVKLVYDAAEGAIRIEDGESSIGKRSGTPIETCTRRAQTLADKTTHTNPELKIGRGFAVWPGSSQFPAQQRGSVQSNRCASFESKGDFYHVEAPLPEKMQMWFFGINAEQQRVRTAGRKPHRGEP